MIHINFRYKLRKFVTCASLIAIMATATDIGSLATTTALADTTTSTEANTEASVNTNSLWPTAPEVTSGSAILIDADTGAILYEKNAHDKGYPASTTKILTGLLVIENCAMDETVTFSREAADSVKYDEASLGTRTGEQYSVEQALYGLLLHSANEIAYGLAEHVSGSLTDFVDIMNARAADMGALNTHFSNASGLHDENHYTTAYDMAMIARGCYNNSTFIDIDSTSSTYVIPPTNKMSQSRYVRHRHSMLKGRSYYYEYCKGGKTGYTDAAGNTLVTFAEKDDMRLICVCFKSTDNDRYVDTKALFDWGFANFNKVTASSDDITSIFSNASYYNSRVYNNYNCRFNINTSTLTLPDGLTVGDVSIAVNDMSQTSTTNNVYTAAINYKYTDFTVGIAKLTIASDANFIATSKLPYKAFDTTEVPTPKEKVSINVWWLILVGGLILVALYIYSEVQRLRRQRRRKRRNGRQRRHTVSVSSGQRKRP